MNTQSSGKRPTQHLIQKQSKQGQIDYCHTPSKIRQIGDFLKRIPSRISQAISPSKYKCEKQQEQKEKELDQNQVQEDANFDFKLSKAFQPEQEKNLQEKIDKKQYQLLQQIQDAKQFSLNSKVFLAKVIQVTDGDTFKAVTYLNNQPIRFTFRTNGLDAPQTRKGEVKQFGKQVKKMINQMIEKKIVKIHAGKFDKYGRVLCKIYTYSQGKELCLNDFLIQNDLAKPYSGKTKNQFTIADYKKFQNKQKDIKLPQTKDYPFK